MDQDRKTPSGVAKLYGFLNRKFGELLDGTEEKEPESTSTPTETSERTDLTEELSAESRSTAHLFAVAEKLQLADGKPRSLGVVLGIAETSSDANSEFVSQRVKVLRSVNSALIGQFGYVVPEDRGREKQPFVIFKNGEHGVFDLVSDANSAKDNQKEVVVPSPPARRTVLVTKDGRLLEISVPDQISILVGDTLSLTSDDQFFGVAKWTNGSGDIVTVEELLEGNQCLVYLGGTIKKVVTIAPSAKNVKVGNRVVLDSSGSLALRNLGNADVGFRFSRVPKVRWADIGGQDEAKLALMQAMIYPIKYRAKYAAIKKKLPKGGLLLGPPGCGKTLLAEATASELLAEVGAEMFAKLFFIIKATELLRSLVGEGEAVIRHVFAQLEIIYIETGIRPLLFIDEIDAIGKKRGTGISSDASDTLLLSLLTEINDTNAYVLGATNRAKVLDEALTRPGRLSRKIYVSRPDQKVSTDILRIYLRDIPVDDNDPGTLADRVAAELFSDKYPLYRLRVVPTEGDPTEVDLGLKDLVSGALIDESLVEEAKLIAIERVKDTDENPRLRFEDFVAAIEMAHHAEQLLDHDGPLTEYSERQPDSTITCNRLYQRRG